MASITQACRMIWIVETIDNESAVWRLHTALKDDTELGDVHQAMETFWWTLTQSTYPLLGMSQLRETSLHKWNASTERFEQHSTATAVALVSTVGIVPVQCADVVTVHAERPFGGVRQSYTNRAYLGPIRTTALDTEGKVLSDVNGQLLERLEALHDDLQAITNDTGVTVGDGLIIVSEKLEECFPIAYAEAGSIVDTQRRRRRSLTEDRESSWNF